MTWLESSTPPRMQSRPADRRPRGPDNPWLQCERCRATLFIKEFREQLNVCPRCDQHGAIPARSRLASLLEGASIREIGTAVVARDALSFSDSQPYPQRLEKAREASSESDAIIVQAGRLRNLDVVAACFEYGFMGGSMGSVVGERFALAVEVACQLRRPFVCITASGGARMQEGLFSLMQMAKTAASVAALRRCGLPFISVLTHPTMGGVSASFAFLADIVIAEPGALIGFAGPRVIEQTVREQLPAGFQRAEFLQSKGAVDMIVDRREQPAMLHRLFSLLMSMEARP